MKEHLTKNLGLCQLQVISISGTWSVLPSFQVRLCFPFLFLYFLITFLHIPYPACRHITSFFLSPDPFLTFLYRWCFFYYNFHFRYFSIEVFGIRLEDFILPVKFVTFIKSPFPLCFYLEFML